MALNIPEPTELLSTEEAAKYMGLSVHTVRIYIGKGMIHSRKIGSARAITREECDRYLRERNPRGNPALQKNF